MKIRTLIKTLAKGKLFSNFNARVIVALLPWCKPLNTVEGMNKAENKKSL